MNGRVTSDLLLVGSLPVNSSRAAFCAGAELFGDITFALPDGETGARAGWVAFERERLIRPNPAVEVVSESSSPDGIARHVYDTPVFRIRDGVTELHFESWPRIDEAVASYALFRDLKANGVISEDLRFQVCLPFPVSALGSFKTDFQREFPIAERAYEELVGRELQRLFAAIPPDQLAIQWDVCNEVLNIEGKISWNDKGDSEAAWQRFADPLERLARQVPEEVLLGYHLCYGTLGGWPMYEAEDMGLLVRMANHAAAHSGRSVDWFHLAGPRVMRSEDDEFFRPLEGLDVGRARIFLGIVLPIDGVAGLRRRHATASRYLHDFGVAMYCGFGRQPGVNGMETMRDHSRVVREVMRRTA